MLQWIMDMLALYRLKPSLITFYFSIHCVSVRRKTELALICFDFAYSSSSEILIGFAYMGAQDSNY